MGDSFVYSRREDSQTKEIKNVLRTKLSQSKVKGKRRRGKKRTFHFYYTDTPITEIINQIAAEKRINIVLPQVTEITPKLTYHATELMTLDEAWDLAISLLDMVGYTVITKGKVYEVIKNDKATATRKPLSVYSKIPAEELPETEEIIRYVWYPTNLSVKYNKQSLTTILNDMLSLSGSVLADEKSNSLIITGKSTNIKAAMRIINELDEDGLRDAIEVIKLHYTSAQLIDDLFNKQLFKVTPPGRPEAHTPYFPKNTKVIQMPRTNSVVIMGTEKSIDLVRDFIVKYLDHPLEAGRSVLHIYNLQYLNAQTFAPILQKIVKPTKTEQTEGKATGAKQYFEGVIVVAEITKTLERIKPTKEASGAIGKYSTDVPELTEVKGVNVGGNNILIAARQDDWLRIKQLIKKLDRPQPQIAVEVLILDVTHNKNKLFGSQMRNKMGWNNSISPRINFQSAHLGEPILKPANPDGTLPPDALKANLLRLSGLLPPEPILSNVAPGSLLISLKEPDGSVWSLWQILDQIMDTSIIAQPFLVTQNHKKATITIEENRFLRSEANPGNAGVVVDFEWVPAALTVDLMPRISKANDNINLQITISIDEYISRDQQNRITRELITNANIGNGEILALGGLTRRRQVVDIHKTPVLGDIPILGWFFKREVKNYEQNNLMVFISPTIVEPFKEGGIDAFTKDGLYFAQHDLNEVLAFENLRDPITRWFFKPCPTMGDIEIAKYKETILGPNGDDIQNDKPKKKVAPPHTSLQAKNDTDKPKEDELKKLIAAEENPLLKTGKEVEA